MNSGDVLRGLMIGLAATFPPPPTLNEHATQAMRGAFTMLLSLARTDPAVPPVVREGETDLYGCSFENACATWLFDIAAFRRDSWYSREMEATQATKVRELNEHFSHPGTVEPFLSACLRLIEKPAGEVEKG